MKQPPGLQLLHCLDCSSQGGKSFFCDSFHAARQLYNTASLRDVEMFKTLATQLVPYHYNQPGSAFFDKKPTFEFEKEGAESLKVKAYSVPTEMHYDPERVTDCNSH